MSLTVCLQKLIIIFSKARTYFVKLVFMVTKTQFKCFFLNCPRRYNKTFCKSSFEEKISNDTVKCGCFILILVIQQVHNMM